jgi:GNAT superfamily N-acetyltransferase
MLTACRMLDEVNQPQPQPAPYVLRRAVRDDLPALQTLLAHLDAPDAPRLGRDEAHEQWSRICETPWYQVWLAEQGGVVVGTYSLLLIPNLAHQGAPGGLIENVVVAPGLRGGGIGAAMMRHAMACARSAGAYKLALSSNKRRLDAHVFYRRLGFRDHGVSLLVQP